MNDTEERKDKLIRFIVFYIICILCITIPLYYLFNIPNVMLGKLNVSSEPQQKEDVHAAKVYEYIKELESYRKESKFEKEYKSGYLSLYDYVKKNMDTLDPRYPVLIKLSDLYEALDKIKEEGGKAEIELLKTQLKEKEDKVDELEKDLDDCKDDLRDMKKSLLN
jgi:hypothetical protein